MFASVISLFGSSFIVGFGVPAAAWIAYLNLYYAPAALTFLRTGLAQPANSLTETVLQGIASIVAVALVLYVFNKRIVRTLSGYDDLPAYKLAEARFLVPVRGINPRASYRRLKKVYGDLMKQRAVRHLTDQEHETLAAAAETLAHRYPEDEKLVLPTLFGNTVRAAEGYSRRMYGFESIRGWNRLTHLMSDKSLDRVQDRKSVMDLWANIWLLSLVAFLAAACEAVISLAVVGRSMHVPTLVIMAAVAFVIAPWLARDAAEEWGIELKSAVDVYLPQLAERMGLDHDAPQWSRQHDWLAMSQAWTFYGLPMPDVERAPDADDPPLVTERFMRAQIRRLTARLRRRDRRR